MQTAATLPPAGGTALAQPQPLPPLRDELKIHPAGNNRDGSPAYYLTEPVVADDAKGVGPLMMAYAESLRL